MRIALLLSLFIAAISACHLAVTTNAAEPVVIKLWKGIPPGDNELKLAPEVDISKPTDETKAGKSIIRLGNVSEPTLTIYKPDPQNDTGATVLVFPGGGYHILAMDLEGTEVCEWLNSFGVTAALLKYRVPRRANQEGWVAPLQDAQRALAILRSRATEFKIDPKRIGCLGFSAGGHLSAMLSTRFEQRTYEATDDSDQSSLRPDFTILIYPAYLVDPKDKTSIAPDMKLSKDMPPVFMTMAQDDPLGSENILQMALELNKLKVPASVHLFPKGGHGYGLRRTADTATKWPEIAAQWMIDSGFCGHLSKPQ